MGDVLWGRINHYGVAEWQWCHEANQMGPSGGWWQKLTFADPTDEEVDQAIKRLIAEETRGITGRHG